jgi:hypothetical protein
VIPTQSGRAWELLSLEYPCGLVQQERNNAEMYTPKRKKEETRKHTDSLLPSKYVSTGRSTKKTLLLIAVYRKHNFFTTNSWNGTCNKFRSKTTYYVKAALILDV